MKLKSRFTFIQDLSVLNNPGIATQGYQTILLKYNFCLKNDLPEKTNTQKFCVHITKAYGWCTSD